MPDETIVVEKPVVEEKKETVNISVSPFGGNAWSETPPEQKKEDVKTEAIVEVKPGETKAEEQKKEEHVGVEDDEIYKKEFGKTKEEFKTEYEELKKFREAKPEYKFENDESKKLAEAISRGDKKEVRRILETQERLEEYTAKEVSDDTAEDIIKFGMQLKYKDLTPKEIDYKFNKDFGLPKQPHYEEAKETEDEFNERKAEWQEKVNDIKMARNIEAKLAKPELEKLKSQIVLPTFENQPAKANEPTPEELEKQKKWAENFLQSFESNYTKADGFSTKVKDESVELPISFKIPDEEKVAIKERFTKGLDIAEYIDKRWFDEGGIPKVEQMMRDLYLLENPDKVFSGIANNAANERLDHYRKGLKNVDLSNGKTHQETFNPEQNGKQVSPFAKDAWSETPIRQN